MTNELIEAMARALQVSGGLRDPWPSLPRWLQSEYKDAARAALAAAKSAGYRLVPVERLQSALEQVQGAMKEAYNSAYPECCGRLGMECCGSPEPAWREEDQHIMDVLQPVQQELSAMLAAAPDHSEKVRPMVPEVGE